MNSDFFFDTSRNKISADASKSVAGKIVKNASASETNAAAGAQQLASQAGRDLRWAIVAAILRVLSVNNY